MERGFEGAIREMANESPEWLGVVLETQARLHHDPEFQRRMEPPPERQHQLRDWFHARQQEGAFRSDVAAQDLARFAAMVLNGLGPARRRRRRDRRGVGRAAAERRPLRRVH